MISRPAERLDTETTLNKAGEKITLDAMLQCCCAHPVDNINIQLSRTVQRKVGKASKI
jgi:hypothetical protein